MNVHCITSCKGQHLLWLMKQIVFKQKPTGFYRYYTTSYLRYKYSQQGTIAMFSEQKYSQSKNDKFYSTRTTNISKSSQYLKEVLSKKTVFIPETDFKERKPQNANRPHIQEFMWQKAVFKMLMKSVNFPLQSGDKVKSVKAINDLSTSDLMSMAQNITAVNKDTMKVIVALWRRLNSMTLEEILTTADIFYCTGVSVPWYNSAMITYIDETFDSLLLTPLQLTRLVFHISNHGSAPTSLLYNIEESLIKNISGFDVNYIAIICQLHFVRQNRIKSPILVDKIAKKLLENVDSLSLQNFSMMMKMLRYSNYINISFYKEFGDRLVKSDYFNRMYTSNEAMHVAYLYASVRVTHSLLFQSILLHCRSHKHFRFKDIAKIMWACGTLFTNQEQSIACIHDFLAQLKDSNKLKQVKEYPDNMMDLMMGLSLLKIYPYDLINIVFNPDIVKIIYALPPEREKFFQLNFLDHSLSIEYPDYSGYRLTEADHLFLAGKVSSNKLWNMDIQWNKSLKPAIAALENALSPECVQWKFVLPHCTSSDIVLAYDLEKKSFVKPVEKALRPVKDNDKQTVNNKIKDLVLLLLTRMQTSFDGQPLGMLQCKIRQLQTLGYTVIMVDADEALSYACFEMERTQKLLLGHISAAVGVDVSKSMLS